VVFRRRITYESSASSAEALFNNVRPICRWRSGESVWCANAAIAVIAVIHAKPAAGSESSRTAFTSHAECRGFGPGQRRAHISADSRGWLYDEFKCREEIWLRRTRTPRNARRAAN
jgi:hypothetical protein